MTMIARVAGAVDQCRPLPGTRPIDHFRNMIRVVPADSRELLDSVFRLRFQVYCLERGFENAAHHPDGRERDADDPRSLHYLLLHRPSSMAVGTVRLILPSAGAELPVSRVVGTHWPGLDLPVESTAEVSRFAIAKTFRRLLQNRHAGQLGRTDGGTQPGLPLLSFGLIQAVVMMSLGGGITHIVAMMEPALWRLLGRLGVEFHAIGEPVHHHGWRQPGWAAMGDLVDRVRSHFPELWELATDYGRGWPKQIAAA